MEVLAAGLVQSLTLVRWVQQQQDETPPVVDYSLTSLFFRPAHQIYCCTGFLSLTSQLHQLNADLLGWWLCERQLPSGGLNGRPEKVCVVSARVANIRSLSEREALTALRSDSAARCLLLVVGPGVPEDHRQDPLDRQSQAEEVHPGLSGRGDGRLCWQTRRRGKT